MSEVSSLTHELKLKVDQLLCKNDNRPLKALWEALNDKATPDIEVPMAIVMDPRCGIERRAESDDNLVDSEGIDLPSFSTPLMLAIRLHRNDVVEALLAAGADPSACDNRDKSAYFVAASNGNVAAMVLLVDYGADPLAVGYSGSSALHLAACEDQAQSIQWFVELGASTEAVDGDGDTPLLRAAYFGNVPSMVALLDNGANLEAEAENGWTPLHSAVAWKHIGAIEALVWEGASITAIDKSGCTPLELFHKVCQYEHMDENEKEKVIALLTPT